MIVKTVRHRIHHRYRYRITKRSIVAYSSFQKWPRLKCRSSYAEAQELEEAMSVSAVLTKVQKLVLFFKYLLLLNGEEEYRLHLNEKQMN